MKVQDLLTDERKWTKNQMRRIREDGTVAYCLFGALDECYRNDSLAFLDAETRLKGAIYGEIDGESLISRFNDSPVTTFADIRRVIEQADI